MRSSGEKGNLIRSFVLWIKQSLGGVQARLKGHPLFTRWSAMRLLALGALLTVGATLYMGMASEAEVGTAATTPDAEGGPAASRGISTWGLGPVGQGTAGLLHDVDVEASQHASLRYGRVNRCHLDIQVYRASPISPIGPDSVVMSLYLEIAGHHCGLTEFEAELGRLPVGRPAVVR